MEKISDKWDLYDYAKANQGKQIETRNFQKVSAILADRGLECIWVRDDSEGVDFIARHMATNEVIQVQLKSRLTIGEKYENHGDLWMAFPVKGEWYLVKHGSLIELADEFGWSWRRGKVNYTNKSPNRKFLEMIEPNKIGTEIP